MCVLPGVCESVAGAGGHGGLGGGRATVSREEQGPRLLGQEACLLGAEGLGWAW